jgi:putative ABC transport system permease protein
VGEIATSLVLLVGAGLLIRSFVGLQHSPLGFDPAGLVSVNVLGGPMRPRDKVPALRNTIVARLRALPGVADVGIGFMPGSAMGAGGLETDAGGVMTRAPIVGTSPVSLDFFHVARLAVVDGRLPDSLSATPMGASFDARLSQQVVVSRSLAQRLFANGRAIGSRVRSVPHDSTAGAGPWSTIVGVVGDTHLPGVRDDSQLLMIYSVAPSRFDLMPMLVRTAVPGTPTAPSIYRAIAGVDPGLILEPAFTGESYVSDSIAPTRFAMALLTAFAVVALVLSAVGLYSVIAYGVSQRTREIGIRVALGAEPRSVAGLVLSGGVKLATIGIVIGIAGAIAGTRALGKLLYEVGPGDPLTLASITALVASIALLASYVPARRAVRIDPIQALRAD